MNIRRHFSMASVALGVAMLALPGCTDLLPTGGYGQYGASPSPSPSGGTQTPGSNGDASTSETPNPNAVDVTGRWGVSLGAGTSFWLDLTEDAGGNLSGTAIVGSTQFPVSGFRQGTYVEWTIQSNGKTVTYTGEESQQGVQVKGTVTSSSGNADYFVAIRH